MGEKVCLEVNCPSSSECGRNLPNLTSDIESKSLRASDKCKSNCPMMSDIEIKPTLTMNKKDSDL